MDHDEDAGGLDVLAERLWRESLHGEVADFMWAGRGVATSPEGRDLWRRIAADEHV